MSTSSSPVPPHRIAIRRAPAYRRALCLVAFAGRFVRELIMANISVARDVLFKTREQLRPGFVIYDLRGLRDTEVVMLTHCITLTPGTTSVEVSADRASLVVHALDASDPDAVRASILEGLEKPLLAWTR